MERPTVAGLIDALKDPKQEGMMYDQIQGIRNRMYKSQETEQESREQLILCSVRALGKILPYILKHTDGASGSPGHGAGHLCRDYLHSLRLAYDESLPVECVIPGILGGTLHDIGTLFVDRYAENKCVVRHAEVGALIVRAAAIETGTIHPTEADSIAYAIAAHTHYDKTTRITCADGMTRSVAPYRDMWDETTPMLEAWLPRWADRLDCSGPCFVGRCYLASYRDREDYSPDNGFFPVTFEEYMRPLLRTPGEIAEAGGKRTLAEFLQMFASSQTNDSPYGKHDRGEMVTLRNTYRAMLERILEEVARPTLNVDVKVLSLAWQLFLGMNIEPTPKGQEAAWRLAERFETLDANVQRAWANGFAETMREYTYWSADMMEFIGTLPEEYLTICGTREDIRKTICPHAEWADLLLP